MGTITSYLNFAVRGQKTPRLYRTSVPADDQIELETKQVTLTEMSYLCAKLDLDEHGFQLHQKRSKTLDHKPITSQFDSGIKRYYQEHERFLQQHLSTPHVHGFNHVYRDNGDPNQSGAIRRVHVDWTRKSAELVIRNRFIDEQANKFLAGRIRLFTIWRPLNGPTYNFPLAVGHAKDVMPSDLIETDLVFDAFVGQNYSVAYNPSQRWYFVNGMEPDEMLLFKNYDSEAENAPYVPHSAFKMIEPDGTVARKSLESRFIVFG